MYNNDPKMILISKAVKDKRLEELGNETLTEFKYTQWNMGTLMFLQKVLAETKISKENTKQIENAAKFIDFQFKTLNIKREKLALLYYDELHPEEAIERLKKEKEEIDKKIKAASK